jgi:hypothetical protein
VIHEKVKVERVSARGKSETWTWTRLCLPPVDLGDARASLVLAGVKVSERIVAFVSQGAQFVLGLD